MPLTIQLPRPLAEELTEAAQREGVSATEHATLLLYLAHALVDWDVGLLAVDMLNPDDTATGASTIHEILLPAGVLIVENLTGLDQLAAGRLYTFALLPIKLAGLDGAPVRAVACDGPLPSA